MTSETPPSASVYSTFFLRHVYEPWVLGVSNQFAWKISTARLCRIYESHVQGDHLEVGVGTGFFPDRCRFPVPRPNLTLLDVNRNCLAIAAHRLERYRPRVVVADLLQPIPLQAGAYRSIHLGYVLHCLAGPMQAKGQALKNLAPILHPEGVLFGSTILPDGGNALARYLTRTYNRRGLFGNAEDTQEGIHALLQSHFGRVEVERKGQVLCFAAWKKP